MLFNVIVFGTIMYETSDELVADAMAHSYRQIWGNATVKQKLN
jgi:hypothetical protein